MIDISKIDIVKMLNGYPMSGHSLRGDGYDQLYARDCLCKKSMILDNNRYTDDHPILNINANYKSFGIPTASDGDVASFAMKCHGRIINDINVFPTFINCVSDGLYMYLQTIMEQLVFNNTTSIDGIYGKGSTYGALFRKLFALTYKKMQLYGSEISDPLFAILHNICYVNNGVDYLYEQALLFHEEQTAIQVQLIEDERVLVALERVSGRDEEKMEHDYITHGNVLINLFDDNNDIDIDNNNNNNINNNNNNNNNIDNFDWNSIVFEDIISMKLGECIRLNTLILEHVNRNVDNKSVLQGKLIGGTDAGSYLLLYPLNTSDEYKSKVDDFNHFSIFVSFALEMLNELEKFVSRKSVADLVNLSCVDIQKALESWLGKPKDNEPSGFAIYFEDQLGVVYGSLKDWCGAVHAGMMRLKQFKGNIPGLQILSEKDSKTLFNRRLFPALQLFQDSGVKITNEDQFIFNNLKAKGIGTVIAQFKQIVCIFLFFIWFFILYLYFFCLN